jgi:hypothetical protein
MAFFIFIIIALAVYLYIDHLSIKQKARVEKERLDQRRIKEQQALLEKRKRDEIQKQKALKEKHELEQKKLREQQLELEAKKQLETARILKMFTANILSNIDQKNIQPFRNKFTILKNEFLKSNITAFYHSDYNSGGNWKVDGTIENMIWTLKNDSSPFPGRLISARKRLEDILIKDLPQILSSTNCSSLTVCVIPRAKRESYYRSDQLYFRQTILDAVSKSSGFYNGVDYIKRHTNTKTTHLRGDGGDGSMPYVGITKDTCAISKELAGKDILLIDDIYTKTVNIDEDAIQALFDNGARSVFFYAIGKTVSRQ